MKRYFAPISEESLFSKIEDAFCNDPERHSGIDPYLMGDVLTKDMKVKFDFENFDTKPGPGGFGPKNLMGYHTLGNGLTFCGMCAGGDWEHPVFFIIYWDGKKLRAYIPTDGNPWNLMTKEAYGNDEEADAADAKKRWPEHFDETDTDYIDIGSFEFEPVLIERDILKRLQPLPKSPPKEEATAEACQQFSLTSKQQALIGYALCFLLANFEEDNEESLGMTEDEVRAEAIRTGLVKAE